MDVLTLLVVDWILGHLQGGLVVPRKRVSVAKRVIILHSDLAVILLQHISICLT